MLKDCRGAGAVFLLCVVNYPSSETSFLVQSPKVNAEKVAACDYLLALTVYLDHTGEFIIASQNNGRRAKLELCRAHHGPLRLLGYYP